MHDHRLTTRLFTYSAARGWATRNKKLVTLMVFGGLIAVGISLFLWLKVGDSVDIIAAQAEYEDVSATVSTDGKVMPVEDFEAVASFAGFVGKVFVKVGDHVHAGEMVVQEKDPFAASRYASAVAGLQGAIVSDDNVRQNGSQEDRINMKGDLNRAQMEQEDAIRSLATLKTLKEKGGASDGEISAAEHRLKLANESLAVLRQRIADRYSRNELVSAKARIADARASLESAKIVLGNANITSPLSGTVYAVSVATNDFVPMGANLLSIADLTKIQIRAYFDEPDIGALVKGQAVEVVWNARPNEVWHGHILQVPLTVSSMGPRIVGLCIVTVDDANGELLPNTNITVKVTTSRRRHVLTIPREALHVEGADRFVFRVTSGRLTRVPVISGLVNLTQVEILGGLNEHEVIALHAVTTHDLSDNLPVRIVR